MPDSRFYTAGEPITASAAAALAGAALVGDGSGAIARAASLDESDLAGALVFASSREAMAALVGRPVGLCLTTEAIASALTVDGSVAVLADPKLGFARVAGRLHRERRLAPDGGVAATARLGAGVIVHAGAAVGADAEIGAGTIVGPHAVIGPGVVIGEGGDIGPGAVITHSLIGVRIIVLPGAKIGQPGFGFAPSPDGLVRIPQLGRVIIGDDVEIGANCTIDRGALGDTRIGDGAKVDNSVHIGHNVQIGRHSVLAAMVGIAGSARVGERVLMGGQVGLADHLTVGDGAQIAARSGVMRDIPAGEKWGGYPARPMRTWFREQSTLSKLAKKQKAQSHDDD